MSSPADGTRRIRPPAVAGSFYPADPTALRRLVESLLGPEESRGPAPKALIAPHAGLVYSGPVAGAAYRRLRPARDLVRHVVLLGPAHRHALPGLAVSGVDAFRTPLGDVPVAATVRDRVLDLPAVHTVEAAHAREHSLEVHLPFLQVVLASFDVLPVVVGDVEEEDVARVLESAWDGPETAIVVSTDLSHYLPHSVARDRDARTARAIVELRGGDIGSEDACGAAAVRGLLAVARRRRLAGETLDLRTSADTAGDPGSVVGYGAFAFHEPRGAPEAGARTP